ncbi:uncharacterized protein LOC116300479 [Actinia tenebrosa]|uniref:Uncharacterized protein LOC116300479 n=1 Tax=Actinia tenebrosa TaxID=6105 RepID=A0A6P8I9F9_ACTTE|nr:uncharacterized protein LOC116300479 [Actinia tenebrosa]
MFSTLILFVSLSLVVNASYGFDSSSKVQLFNILLKPFGVSLLQDVVSDLLSTSWKTSNCTRHLQKLQACNATVLNLFNDTTSSEETLVTSLSQSCSSGRFRCLQQQVSKSTILRGWFQKVKVDLHQVCRNQCWKISLDVEKNCIHSKTESKKVGFTFEVLDAFCYEPKPLTPGHVSYCTDYFIEGLFTQVKDEEVCDVTKAIDNQRCSSSCYQEILDFYHSLDSCVSVITDTMKKYSVSPSPNTFGVIVQNSTVMCGKNQPREISQPTRSSHTTTANTTNSQNQTTSKVQSPPSRPSSLSGKLIAAIVVAVIVFVVAGAVLCRYLYQRCINKPKLRFEDYGYSHLQMMQDQEDFYFNDDDDDDHGLLDL